MKKKLLIIIISFAVLTVILSPILINNAKAYDLMKGVEPKQITSTAPDKSYIDSFNNFASTLFISAAENNGNILISPASVYLALAITVNGAEGDTKTEMLNILSNNSLLIDKININSSNLISELNYESEKTSLLIANSFWYNKDFVPYEPFLQTNADYYGAGLKKLDLSDSNAPSIINNWVKDATKGKIGKIIEEIDPDTAAYIINAIYFKSDWEDPFSAKDTKEMTFFSPSGEVRTDFLNKTGSVDYLSGFGAKGVLLYYENSKFAYFAILPDNNISPRQWAKSHGEDLFGNIFNMISNKQTDLLKLSMPKYEVDYEDSLKNELQKSGMIKAFDKNTADFSSMNKEHLKNLYIQDIMHKTYIKVDEKGTEAAAVTSVQIGLTSAPPLENKELIFDKPFIYGIVDTESDSIIFTGIMENPM